MNQAIKTTSTDPRPRPNLQRRNTPASNSKLSCSAAYNMGILHWTPMKSEKKLAKEGKKLPLADGQIWDGNGFNRSFRRSLNAGCIVQENMEYENSSRIEPKHGNQQFMNTGEPEIFSNKNQTVEAVSGSPISRVSHVNASPWDNNSGSHSVMVETNSKVHQTTSTTTIDLKFP